MFLLKTFLNPTLKTKFIYLPPVRYCYKGEWFDERLAIGKREWVGYGTHSLPNYVDIPLVPMPAVRFKEITAELMPLKEKEKGDWKKLTLDEKKTLYRASFCQTLSEVKAPTGEWKNIIALSILWITFGIAMFIATKVFVGPELPDSFSEERRALQFRRMLVNRDGHFVGISSKWDYEKDDWK